MRRKESNSGKKIEEIEEGEKRIKDMLPHGGGFDCDWVVIDMGRYFRCHGGYHAKNEFGMYDGWQSVQVIIPKNKPSEFKLHFINGNYISRKYDLRDYIEDTIYYELEKGGMFEREELCILNQEDAIIL